MVALYEWWTNRRLGRIGMDIDRVYERGLVSDPALSTVGVHQMNHRDHVDLERVRGVNRAWLGPWDASVPNGYPTKVPDVHGLARAYAKDIRHGRAMPLVVVVDGVSVGHITVTSIARGASQSGQLGYWIDEGYANKGVMTLAVAMAIDLCFRQLRLHRVEVNVRPENKRSLRLIEKLGLEYEGVRRKLLHVGDSWCDHYGYAMIAEDYPPQGMVAKLEGTHH